MNRWSEGSTGRGRAVRLGVLSFCVGVALMLGVSTLLAAGAPSFASPRSYSIGSYAKPVYPYSLAIGDLDGDGMPDLVTANSASTVSMLRNKGDGSFQAKRDYRTVDMPLSVAIGDLNADGKLDLATANYDSTASVLLNRGDGSFHTQLGHRTGRKPVSIAISDFDGDGKPDLATANSGANTVSVLLNRGDGTFRLKRDYRTGKKPYSVAIGDLNGDSKPDLATANRGANTVSVLLNRGDGTFRAKRDYRTGKEPSSLAIGDLNGDGELDLAIANSLGSSVSVLLNRDGGRLQAKRPYRTGTHFSSESIAIGDLNGDGKSDLVTPHAGVRFDDPGVVSVLVNRGKGSFQAKLDYAVGDPTPGSIAIGDLNADGNPDLATASLTAHSVSVHLNRPGLCTVQNVAYLRVVEGLHDPQVTIIGGMTLPAARRTLARANCRVGAIRRAYSKVVTRGRVISQKPKFGTVRPGGSRVNLIVSRGPPSA